MRIVAVVTRVCFVAVIMLVETVIMFIKTGFFKSIQGLLRMLVLKMKCDRLLGRIKGKRQL